MAFRGYYNLHKYRGCLRCGQDYFYSESLQLILGGLNLGTLQTVSDHSLASNEKQGPA